mgnify:CR=1 FL=1
MIGSSHQRERIAPFDNAGLHHVIESDFSVFQMILKVDISRLAPKGVGDVLTIKMKYSAERDRTISGLRRISTPGLRVYRKASDVPRVLGGLGVAVLSTSHGLMTDREARKRKVGGEVLCFVW